MSQSQSAASEKRIRVMRPAGTTLVVKWPALITLLQTILRLTGGWQLQIDGAESMRTDVNGGIQAKIKPGTSDNPHPFQVSHVSGDTFKVQAGTCEGQLITTRTIDVGSARPVAILAYPQYTLGIDTGGTNHYVNTMIVKTGDDAPVLEASTSTLSDVDSGINSDGTQARALIAYIDSSNVISQIAMGNISGEWDDDGSLTGLAAGTYNKNF